MQSGKNRVLITRTGHRYPPKRFALWRDEMVHQLYFQTSGVLKPIFPNPRPVSLTVRYWPGDKIRRDATGILDALCHVLEKIRIIEDDAQIKAVDWKEMALDRTNPRVELSLVEQRVG